MTIVTLNLLNSIIPVFTDSVILFHLVKEKAAQSNSRTELIATMGTPVFLKFARLVSAVLFIRISADFIYASFATTKHGAAPDFADVEAARTRGVYMSSGLELFDNVLVVVVAAAACRAALLTSLHTLTAFLWEFTGRISTRYGRSVLLQVCPHFPLLLSLSYSDVSGISLATLSQKSLSDLVWTFGSHYILPIILNAVQLATASLMPSSNAASLIDSVKVVLNIASASVEALRKKLPALATQVSLEVKEGLSRVATKVPGRVLPSDGNVVIAPARDRDLVSEETADPKESKAKEIRL